MLRSIAPALALLLSAAPVLADVSTLELPRLSWPTATVAGPQTTTTSASNSR